MGVVEQETRRLNDLQLKILVKNHGSKKAVKLHLGKIERLIAPNLAKAKNTKISPKTVKVTSKEGIHELVIDPVSLDFHRRMNIAKRKANLIGRCK